MRLSRCDVTSRDSASMFDQHRDGDHTDDKDCAGNERMPRGRDSQRSGEDDPPVGSGVAERDEQRGHADATGKRGRRDEHAREHRAERRSQRNGDQCTPPIRSPDPRKSEES